MLVLFAVTFPLDMIKTRLQIQGQDTGLTKSVNSQDTLSKNSVNSSTRSNGSDVSTSASGRQRYRGVFRIAIGVGKLTPPTHTHTRPHPSAHT